jgi:hypothetical protein
MFGSSIKAFFILKKMKHCINKDIKDLPNEVWVSVIDYSEYYEISNFGRIKSVQRVVISKKGFSQIRKEKIKSLRLPNEKNGRTNTFVEYSCNGINKRYNLSKQVALHFISNYNNEALYFIDGDRSNCSVKNLIVVNKENVISLYDKNTIFPPNKVSDLLHKMGLKKCSVCKSIKKISEFSKSNRNRDTNNNCQICVNKIVYKFRNRNI